jgi:uncharacterized protein YdaU (DUF1376 family)
VHFFPLHINDYAQATSHLTLLEDAVYFRLLRKYYADEKPLIGDIDRIQRLIGARSKEEKDAVKAVLEEFFSFESDCFRNKRADAEIEKFRSKSLKAKESANTRWMRTHSEGNAEPMRQPFDCNANQEPITKNQEPKEKNKRTSAPVVAKPDEVTDQTWMDFLAHRKLKKATVSDTVLDAIRKEARKAGWSLDAALRECVARNWQGFKSEWVKPDKKSEVERTMDFLLGRDQRPPSLNSPDPWEVV